ncbi:MAG: hypothetical protein HOH58_13880 [Opitutaceae bacterium]|nr:hypothetical protein [Opitutaceae bacterium]
MSPVEILFALQRIPPFESVTDGELEIAAKVLVVRKFAPGALVLGSGEPFRRLLIKLDGSWLVDKAELPGVLGVESLLSGVEGPGEIVAGPTGARCLMMTRGHFFTFINECPSLLLSLLTRVDKIRSERDFI